MCMPMSVIWVWCVKDSIPEGMLVDAATLPDQRPLPFEHLGQLQDAIKEPGHKYAFAQDACCSTGEKLKLLDTLSGLNDFVTDMDTCETKNDLAQLVQAAGNRKKILRSFFQLTKQAAGSVNRQIDRAAQRCKVVAKAAAAAAVDAAASKAAKGKGKSTTALAPASPHLPGLFRAELTDEFAVPTVRLVAEGLTQEAVQKELQERGIVLHEPYVVQAPGLQGILASQEMKVKIGAFHAQFLTSAEWRTAHGRGAMYEPLSHALPVLKPFFHPHALPINKTVINQVEDKVERTSVKITGQVERMSVKITGL